MDSERYSEKLEGVLPFYPFERLNNHNFINLTGQDLKKTFDFIADFNSLESDVILATFLKSGSHWVHEIITMLLTQNSSKYNNGPLLLDTNLGLIDEKTAATFPKPRLFHTHFSFQYLPRKHVENGYKIVQLNRNPKDRHVSMYHFMLGKTGVPDWTWADYFELFVVGNEDLCGGWFNDTKEWLDAKKMYPDNIFLLQYEQLIKSPQNTVTNLAKFLDVPYTDSFVNEVIDKCSFEKLKENKIDASRCIHPEGKSTLFREGKIGGWKKWFTVSQNERFDELYKTEMAGYDVDFVYT